MVKEDELINYIRKRAGKPGGKIKTGIGDDCAVLNYSKEEYLLQAADMLVDGVHFNSRDVLWRDIGHKAVAVNISDIAAMGGVPKYIVVSVGVPGHMNAGSIKRIYDGVFDVCGKYGIKVIGGDTVRSETLVINVSITGFVKKSFLTERRGARAGDLILVTGPVRNGKMDHMSFSPRLDEALFLTRNYKISAMMDISDGIAVDLSRMCAESRTGCRIYSDAVPLSDGLELKDALNYGESFELLFTMPPKETRKLFLDLGKTGKCPVFYIIGEMFTERCGMKIVGREGKITALKTEGFRHL